MLLLKNRSPLGVHFHRIVCIVSAPFVQTCIAAARLTAAMTTITSSSKESVVAAEEEIFAALQVGGRKIVRLKRKSDRPATTPEFLTATILPREV
jgi:hypothetical protein